ncbi:MAG TPA: tetratricopeptide repeat protein [Terriglobia bacterium]|nr:tetratricopeptide repeat protein [Terriglobia bacterium]
MAAKLYEFGPFTLRPSEHRLLRDGRPVSLSPKAFDVLLLLVESAGGLVSKDDLAKKVWPSGFSEEANLTANIAALRKALGHRPDGQEYIETVPRLGYRFTPWSNQAVTGFELDPNAPAALPTVEAVEAKRNRVNVTPHRGRPPVTSTLGDFLSRRKPSRKLTLALVAFVALLAVGLWSQFRRRPEPSQVSAGTRSIAVLPFQSLSSSPDQEYLGLGLPDALITQLGGLRQIVVRPTGSIRQYSPKGIDPLAAGRELKVDSVLVGSVQRSEDRIRVTVRLLRVADGAQLWADTFDEKFTDLFAVEDSISQQVSKALALQLSGQEQQQLAKRYTQNSDAHQLYLKGRYFWGKRTPAGVDESIHYFQQAIAADPQYALAYSGLADSYLLQGSSGYSQLRPQEAMQKAMAAAERALALDDTLAEAHTSLGYVKLIFAWDWQGAEQEFHRALELNPSDTTALHWYSHYLTAMGRHQESVAASKRALAINPVDLPLNEHLAWVYIMARQYDLAVDQCRKTLEMDPDFALAHRRLGETYEYQGKYPEAIAEFQKALELSGGAIVYKALLGQAYALSGRREDAERSLRELMQLSRERYISSTLIAAIYLDLGEHDQAFHWLDKAYEERSDLLTYAKVDPTFDGLHSDPRWAGLLERLKLEQ